MLVLRLRPRRRALRLPLGLLPLVLLLLAVQRLARAVDWQPPQHVIQISMPIPWAEAQARMRERPEERLLMLYFTIPPGLDRQRTWQSYHLIGNTRHDAATLRAIAARLDWGETHLPDRADVRISFGPDARYEQVVAALNLMLQTHQTKYALDLYRAEPVLYVFARRGLWDKHDRVW